ncbi:MAG: hypothetical protein OCD02_20730 [Spirochaetaceae bacterium]
MKKIIMVLLFTCTATAFISAEGFDFDDFPTGKWIDSNYDAVWEFESNNIRILDSSGNLFYDFNGTVIENFKVEASTEGLVLSFYCEDTSKKYKFIKPLSNMNLSMEINKDSGLHYGITLPIVK